MTLAKTLIQQWKNDPAIRDQFADNRQALYVEAKARLLWERMNAETRNDSGSFENFLAIHKRG